MMGLFALLLVSVVISQYYNALNQAELGKTRRAEYGRIHFSGKVIHYRIYRYMNKKFYQVCVKLDSANVKSLLVYNDDDAIKIDKGTATFSAGFFNRVLGAADSVSVNMNNSDKVVLYYSTAHAIDTRDFKFEPMGLQRGDLDSCR